MRKQIADAKETWVNVKTSEIPRLQQRVKAFEAVIESVQEPINECTEYLKAMRLFAKDFDERPVWNFRKGIVDWTSAPLSGGK